MNYELAKELKDAGFVIKDQHEHIDGCMSDGVCAPTLEELIEACEIKVNDFCLRNFNTGCDNQWICGEYMPYEHDWIVHTTGSTPPKQLLVYGLN